MRQGAPVFASAIPGVPKLEGLARMLPAETRGWTSRYIVIDGIRTHYIEQGSGRPVVLLHDGAYGGSAEVSWFANIDALSQHYRVVAPDLLGFGKTDKLFDFGGNRTRRMSHLRRFVEVLDLGGAAFCGVSMGASMLFEALTDKRLGFPVSAAICASGGGFVPHNEARERILNFDCTLDGMRTILSAMLHDESLLANEHILEARFQSAMAPGAWEAAAATRFASPLKAAKASIYGMEDHTPYETIDVPVLVMAGENDKLKVAGYATELSARLPQSEVHVFARCGHLPNIEQPAVFNKAALEFFARVYPSQ